MRHLISGGLIAAALGTALLAAGAFPASAQVARPQSSLAAGDNDHGELLTLARGTISHGGGGGGGGSHSFGMGGDRRSFGTGGDRSFAMARDPRTDRRFDRDDMRNRIVDRDDLRRHRIHRGGDHDIFCDDRNGRCRFFAAFAFGDGGYYDDYYDDYYYNNYAGNDAVAYCMSRFQSYDPASRTYLGYDGRRHPCP